MTVSRLNTLLRRLLAKNKGRFGLFHKPLTGSPKQIINCKFPFIEGAHQQADAPAGPLFAGLPPGRAVLDKIVRQLVQSIVGGDDFTVIGKSYGAKL